VVFQDRDDARLRGCLERSLPHADRRAIALAGGIAIDLHVRARYEARARRPLSDVDLVAADWRAVAPGVTGEFLVRHFHLPQPGYPKFLIQLVDPASRLRIDVFPDLVGSLRRAAWHEVSGLRMRVLDADSMLDHKLAALTAASATRPCERKHREDAVLLGALCGREVPAVPAEYLCQSRYSSDVDAACARCEASRTTAFPLASARQVLDILGYV
jgi:hypothetical protein